MVVPSLVILDSERKKYSLIFPKSNFSIRRADIISQASSSGNIPRYFAILLFLPIGIKPSGIFFARTLSRDKRAIILIILWSSSVLPTAVIVFAPFFTSFSIVSKSECIKPKRIILPLRPKSVVRVSTRAKTESYFFWLRNVS